MKKIVSILVALTMAAGAFAKVDKLNGVLSDESNYMDVNNWQKVNPKTIFLTADLSSTSQIDVGFAKDFGGLYMALAYAGSTWAYMNVSTTKTENTTDSSWTSTYENTTPEYSYNYLSALFGFGNFSIRPWFSITRYSSTYNKSNESSDGTKADEYKNVDDFNYGVETGYNMGNIQFEGLVEGSTALNQNNLDSGNGTEVNNSITYVTFSGYVRYIMEQSNLKQTFQCAAECEPTIFSATTSNQFNLYAGLCPSYKVELNPSSNVYLSANAYGWFYLQPSSTSSTSSAFNTSFGPHVNVGMNVAIKPEFLLFLNWNNTLPSLIIATTKDTGTADHEISTCKFSTGNYYSNLSTGFGWLINKDVAVRLSLDLFNYDNSLTVKNVLDNSFTISCSMKF